MTSFFVTNITYLLSCDRQSGSEHAHQGGAIVQRWRQSGLHGGAESTSS